MNENNIEGVKGAGNNSSIPPQSSKVAQMEEATTSDVGSLDIVINDMKGIPISDLEFQIKIKDQIVSSDKTDAKGKGKTIEDLKIGSTFDIYVKTDKGEFKRVAIGTMESEHCVACLTSPKTRFEFSTDVNKGDPGKAAEHKKKVIKESGNKQTANLGNAAGNELKPHTVKIDNDEKGKSVVLVIKGGEASGARAPWMKVALSEARKWAGKSEKDITKNYHKIADENSELEDLAGDSHAWCASFINAALKESGYEVSTNKGKDKDKPACNVNGFDTVHFVKISKPVYGAIAVYGNHAVLIYGKCKRKIGHLVVLGGNQSDEITFVCRSATSDLKGFYVPAKYEANAKKEIKSGPVLTEYDYNEMNIEYGIPPYDGKPRTR